MTPGFTAFRRRVAIGGLVLLVCMSACSSPAGAREVNDSPTTYVTQLADTALTPEGWSPLGLGTIQISVPSGWFVEDPGTICGGGARACAVVARYRPHGALLRASSREIVEGLRPSRRAMERIDSPAARPRASSSRSSNER